MTTEELTCCDECEAEIEGSAYDAGDGLCPTCLARTFACEDCGERTPKADAHPDIAGLCLCCGDSAIEAQHEERLDAAKARLDDLVEAIKDAEDLAVIAKAIRSLRRLSEQPKE